MTVSRRRRWWCSTESASIQYIKPTIQSFLGKAACALCWNSIALGSLSANSQRCAMGRPLQHCPGRLRLDFVAPMSPDSSIQRCFPTERERMDGTVKITSPAGIGVGTRCTTASCRVAIHPISKIILLGSVYPEVATGSSTFPMINQHPKR